MPHTANRLPREGLILLLSLALCWGFNWSAMKTVLTELPPLSFRGFCLIFGGIGVLVIARLNGKPLAIPRGYGAKLFWLVLFNMVGWNVFATYGVKLMPSGRAALLGYTMPLWCVPLSVWLLHEALDARRLVALALGLGGVAVLLSQSLTSLASAPLGVTLMIAAAWCWATGIVLLKLWKIPMNTVALTGWMMLFGGIPVILGAFFIDGLPQKPLSLWPALGLIYNLLIGFMYCYWAWNRLVLLVPVSVSSLSSLLTPLVGIASGMIFLGEQPGWHEGIAALLILGAVGVVSVGSAKRF
ncbi:DMT family transporter [Uliginosibacterium sp. sgz301328]|uniref:DMT family transporter n=1 Tax=Uliginosibacterium sp. sgz301328 TaxID=3243764 RepID=UPI00359E1A8B